MELYVLAGGQVDSLNRWQQDLNAQFFPVYKDGKHLEIDGIKQYRRLLVAPVQLFKIAFNKENLDDVVACVHPNPYIENRYPIIKKTAKWIMKLLGVKAVPKPKYYNAFLQPNQIDKAVFVQPIGIKEDKLNGNGEEMI